MIVRLDEENASVVWLLAYVTRMVNSSFCWRMNT